MKWRILALMAILAVTLTAAPAFAWQRYVVRRAVPRAVWRAPVVVSPRVYYRPPVYVAPRLVPNYYWRQPTYWVPGGYPYDEPSLGLGIGRGGFGLRVDF
ncbi:MAG: hypothetical protein ACYC3X_25960 [Pirellulaceae bacterium]